MKTFHCTHCQAQVFFENVECLNCGSPVAYLPDHQIMAAIEQRSAQIWQPIGKFAAQRYRLCDNFSGQGICNWAVPADDAEGLCVSCRLTRVIPTLTAEGKAAWQKLECAKRRLVHNLLTLQLQLHKKDRDNPDGVSFEFLQDFTTSNGDTNRILTGHDNGLITINVAEADDVHREHQRTAQHEPYRTLLGHFRHEIGHYFWDRLIANGPRLHRFRVLFGDERADYAQALRRHYETGPPDNWQETHISAYATSHPWEDWAETWAHYLHMVDCLETAQTMGLSLKPVCRNEPAISPVRGAADAAEHGFDDMIRRWVPLTYAMNSLNRGLGLADSYPFVLSDIVIEKLRFIHDTLRGHRMTRAATLSRSPGRMLLLTAIGVVAVTGLALLSKRKSAPNLPPI